MPGIDSDTKLMLHMNSDFSDSSASNHIPTLVNAPLIFTSVKKFGAGSGRFIVSSSQRVTYPDHPDFTLGSSDFTFDLWTRRISNGTVQFIFGQSLDGNNVNSSFAFKFNATNLLQFLLFEGATAHVLDANTTITSLETQIHLAVVRDGNTLRLFIDGVQDNTLDITGVSANDVSAKFALGAIGEVDSVFYNGYIDEFRFSNVARWTSNFTPPTEEYSGSVPTTAAIALPILVVQGGSGATGHLTLPILVVQGGSGATGHLTLPILSVLGDWNPEASVILPILSVDATSLGGRADLTLPSMTVQSFSFSGNAIGFFDLPVLTVSATDVPPATATLSFPLLTVNATDVPPATATLSFPLLTVNATAELHGTVNIALITASPLTLHIRVYNGSAPDCVVMNTKNFAVTEYLNYGFNSMTKFNGANLIADQNGIYEEDGSDTDHAGIDDYPIKAHVKSGRIDLFKGSINKLRNAWVYYQSDGDIRIVTRSDKKETRNYDLPFHDTTAGINERRIKFQKGLRNRYVDFKTQNILGSQMEIDKITITLEPVVSKRR